MYVTIKHILYRKCTHSVWYVQGRNCIELVKPDSLDSCQLGSTSNANSVAILDFFHEDFLDITFYKIS